MRKIIIPALASACVLFGACNGYPNTPQGNSAGLALYEVGVSRASNPPFSDPNGFDCWEFVNWVENGAGTPRWVNAQGPGTFSAYLTPDPRGVNPGDIVVFAPSDNPQTAVHVGIIYAVSPGDFGSVEWNSAEDPNRVVVNYHPNDTVTPDPATGLVLMASYLP